MWGKKTIAKMKGKRMENMRMKEETKDEGCEDGNRSEKKRL